MISIIIPANNEENYLGACLQSIAESEAPDVIVEVIVVANGCTDMTVSVAEKLSNQFKNEYWKFQVLNISEGSKIKALNLGDSVANFSNRIYLDADICISPRLLIEIIDILKSNTPIYSSGTLTVPPAKSAISRNYARFWVKLPFVSESVPGCGLFAVNSLGRDRWKDFPDIISDDMFVRSHFKEYEMRQASEDFQWPIAEGFSNLVKVRRRQNDGLHELKRLFPDLMHGSNSKTPSARSTFSLFISDPIGFIVYLSVSIAVLLPVFAATPRWYRGR